MSKSKNETSITTDVEAKEAGLKKKYDSIIKMSFKVKDKTLVAYVRNPDLSELDATISTLQTSPISSSVGLFVNCFVDGDQELLQLAKVNSGLAIAIHKEIQTIIPVVVGESISL
jgi:hypothetical protein